MAEVTGIQQEKITGLSDANRTLKTPCTAAQPPAAGSAGGRADSESEPELWKNFAISSAWMGLGIWSEAPPRYPCTEVAPAPCSGLDQLSPEAPSNLNYSVTFFFLIY